MKQQNFYLKAGKLSIAARPQRGLTLVELLISMVIGLIILGAGSAIYISSVRSSSVSEQSTRLNEDGVLALNFLQSQIRQAGYYGKIEEGVEVFPAVASPLPTNDQAFYLPPVKGCTGAFGNETDYRNITCAAAAGNDAIVVQYEADASNTYPTAANPLLPTNCNGESIANTYIAGRYQAVNRFYIANNTLMCIGNTAPNVVSLAQPLFPNIEQMVVRYGIAANTMIRQEREFDADRHQVVAYATANQVNALGGTTNENWGRVRSVQICLLVRSESAINDGSNVGAYTDCNNAAQNNADNRLRRTFVSTVMLRNRVVAPETP